MPFPLIQGALFANQVASTATSKPKPNKSGNKDGAVTYTVGKNAFGGDVKVFWKWEDGSWKQINEGSYKQATGNTNYIAKGNEPEAESVSTSLRYPADISIGVDSDYVLFEFFEYQPPFNGTDAGINKTATERLGDFAKLFIPGVALADGLATATGLKKRESYSSRALALYNQSVSDSEFYEKTSKPSLVMYMPEDISTGYRASWSGKKFSNLGANMLKTIGSKNPLQGLENAGKTAGRGIDNLIPQTTNKVIRETIGKITGESVTADDVFASTRGVILNPNVELLFSGHDLRNFSLSFKLVPRNNTESGFIKKIINTFRAAMLPNFADGDELTFSSSISTAANFIKVPNLCKISFMRGGGLNPDVPQYKMCAMTQVDVNYTPDGTYATLEDGSMVAYQLDLSFQETKLIFSEEVEKY